MIEIASQNLTIIILIGVLGFFSFYTVRQQDEGVVERFGKFVRKARPGLNLKIPFIENVVMVNTQVQQLDVKIETKTHDNVFVDLNVSVQFLIIDSVAALYRLSNPREQIAAYVFDVVRAQVPKLILDDVFDKKDDIAGAVKSEISESMQEFGYSIIKTLVTDISPNEKVKEAMNEINAANRMREAAIQKAEAEKIMVVKKAEAEAESKALQGKGVAMERVEITKGFQASIDLLRAEVDKSITHEEVFNLLLVTQYFDTIKSLGNQGSHTIFMPTSPQGVSDIQSQIISAIKAAKK